VEEIADLQLALGRLSPRDRQVIAWRFWEDLAQWQVAAQLGLKEQDARRFERAALDQLGRDLRGVRSPGRAAREGPRPGWSGWASALTGLDDDEEVTVEDLAARCGISPPSVSALLPVMERLGWVELRVESRRRLVRLTPQGRRQRDLIETTGELGPPDWLSWLRGLSLTEALAYARAFDLLLRGQEVRLAELGSRARVRQMERRGWLSRRSVVRADNVWELRFKLSPGGQVVAGAMASIFGQGLAALGSPVAREAEVAERGAETPHPAATERGSLRLDEIETSSPEPGGAGGGDVGARSEASGPGARLARSLLAAVRRGLRERRPPT